MTRAMSWPEWRPLLFFSTTPWAPRGVSTRSGQGVVEMDWKLEVVLVPVSDIDRALHFYAEQVGFTVDHDTRATDEARII
jgi:hypothetical protein